MKCKIFVAISMVMSTSRVLTKRVTAFQLPLKRIERQSSGKIFTRRFLSSTIGGLNESGTVMDEIVLMEDMLNRIREVNYMPEEVRETVLDFMVDGVKVGKVSNTKTIMLEVLLRKHNAHLQMNKCPLHLIRKGPTRSLGTLVRLGTGILQARI